jgi:hypothetical protein
LNRLPRVTTKNHAFQPGRQAPADPIGIPGWQLTRGRLLAQSGLILGAKSRSPMLLAKRGVLSFRSGHEAQPCLASIGDLATRLIE